MASFTIKAGDSFTAYEARLIDRKDKPLDLSNATAVRLYMRPYAGGANTLNGDICPILAASSSESYPQRVTGPVVTLNTPGDYVMHFKVQYGASSERVPSQGTLRITVEDSFG